MPVLPLDCHLPTQKPHIPSSYSVDEQTTKETKAINNSYIYIYISHVNVTRTVPDISPLMPMHQYPLLVNDLLPTTVWFILEFWWYIRNFGYINPVGKFTVYSCFCYPCAFFFFFFFFFFFNIIYHYYYSLIICPAHRNLARLQICIWKRHTMFKPMAGNVTFRSENTHFTLVSMSLLPPIRSPGHGYTTFITHPMHVVGHPGFVMVSTWPHLHSHVVAIYSLDPTPPCAWSSHNKHRGKRSAFPYLVRISNLPLLWGAIGLRHGFRDCLIWWRTQFGADINLDCWRNRPRLQQVGGTLEWSHVVLGLRFWDGLFTFYIYLFLLE